MTEGLADRIVTLEKTINSSFLMIDQLSLSHKQLDSVEKELQKKLDELEVTTLLLDRDKVNIKD